VHLRQIKEKNPRLKKSTAPVFSQLPPCPTKRNIHLQTVVDGGCSSVGAETPRLLEVEDEIMPEREKEVEMKAKQKVAESGEELSSKDNATQAPARGSNLDAEGAGDEDIKLYLGGAVEAENVGVAVENVNCTKGRVKSFECAVKECRKMFYRRRPMEDHMRKTHGAEKLSCSTPGCEVKFVSCWGLQRHIDNGHHKDKMKNKIENIETRASIVSQLTKTGTLQQGKKRTVIECKVEGCPKRFPLRVGYLRDDHMRMEHGQSKLVCQKCEASYFSRDGLNRHMKKTHKEENDAKKPELKDTRGRDTDEINESSTVGKVRDMSPISVKVLEPEVEVLDMEIF